VQYAKANFCSISVRDQTRKVARSNRHQTESNDAGFFILDKDIKNCEWNGGLAEDLYNDIRMLEKFD
jgi:hypothetical protein